MGDGAEIFSFQVNDGRVAFISSNFFPPSPGLSVSLSIDIPCLEPGRYTEVSPALKITEG